MKNTVESLTEELNESTAALSVAVLEDDTDKIKEEAKLIARLASLLLLLLESTED